MDAVEEKYRKDKRQNSNNDKMNSEQFVSANRDNVMTMLNSTAIGPLPCEWIRTWIHFGSITKSELVRPRLMTRAE